MLSPGSRFDSKSLLISEPWESRGGLIEERERQNLPKRSNRAIVLGLSHLAGVIRKIMVTITNR